MSGVQKIVVLLLAAITCVTATGNDDHTTSCWKDNAFAKQHVLPNSIVADSCNKLIKSLATDSVIQGSASFNISCGGCGLTLSLAPSSVGVQNFSAAESKVIDASNTILLKCNDTPGTNYFPDDNNVILELDLWQDISTTACPSF